MLVFTDAVALWSAHFLRAIDVTTRAIDVTTAGLHTQFFPCCTFAIHSFSQVSATPVYVPVQQPSQTFELLHATYYRMTVHVLAFK